MLSPSLLNTQFVCWKISSSFWKLVQTLLPFVEFTLFDIFKKLINDRSSFSDPLNVYDLNEYLFFFVQNEQRMLGGCIYAYACAHKYSCRAEAGRD